MQVDRIVLAAGEGTRMKSALPKVMHRAAGRSLLGHVLSAAAGLGEGRTAVVCGPGMDSVSDEARSYESGAFIAVQAERRGTAHAVSMAAPLFEQGSGRTIVLYGDVPLIRTETLAKLLARIDAEHPMAVLAFEAASPAGYGRLILDRDNRLQAIREELDATDEERRITLCNSGVVAADSSLLWRLLPDIGCNNRKNEYYLTDLVGLALAEGAQIAHLVCPEEEVLGVNTRFQLSEVERRFQDRLRRSAMDAGVTMIAPETVHMCADTVIGPDTLIEPNVVIGTGVSIGKGVTIRGFCHLEQAQVADGAVIGPFARLRPGASIGPDAHIGNFVEIKKADIEKGAKVNHLAYVGDARVGEKANVGAGTITCNYDGVDKHFTDIGAGAFIGSNSALVAPVKIGDGAYVGSGSVITRDVEADALAVERSQQVVRPGWAKRFRDAKAARKHGNQG